MPRTPQPADPGAGEPAPSSATLVVAPARRRMRTGWRLFSGGLGATWLLLVASAVSSAVVHRDEPGLARVGEYAFLYFWGPAFAYLMAAAVGAYVIGGRFPWVRRALAILVLVVLLALAALALVDAVAG